jgi:S1-C subfamily serine protease
MTVENLSPQIAARFGLEAKQVVVVTGIEASGPAARAGIVPGVIILAVGDKPVTDLRSFREAIKDSDLKSGVRLQIQTKGARSYVFLGASN